MLNYIQATNTSATVLAATGDDEVIGYTCGTCSSEENLTHESMSTHVPGGSTLCIHSVAVTEVQRRKGIALRMLKVCAMLSL
jgi:hypothetical protein